MKISIPLESPFTSISLPGFPVISSHSRAVENSQDILASFRSYFNPDLTFQKQNFRLSVHSRFLLVFPASADFQDAGAVTGQIHDQTIRFA